MSRRGSETAKKPDPELVAVIGDLQRGLEEKTRAIGEERAKQYHALREEYQRSHVTEENRGRSVDPAMDEAASEWSRSRLERKRSMTIGAPPLQRTHSKKQVPAVLRREASRNRSRTRVVDPAENEASFDAAIEPRLGKAGDGDGRSRERKRSTARAVIPGAPPRHRSTSRRKPEKKAGGDHHFDDIIDNF
ncbi:hypothetical protein BU16DRAFT_543424 [Lophium mytilinum]|uniref:Uncharacterized protein n=1 Tax=Lophium mytilinum TaxID=390894 RepID=A0A6A6QGQ9_9PEZI|nr:hypothetical protein BU16DRAFT_543424 [Lophium mytilinum]